MKRFLAIGECMVEMAQTADGLYRRGFAGDTFNTAWYARRLLGPEWQVSYGTCIGTDAASDEMAAWIADQGIETRALRCIEDRTVGLYMISLQNGERSFSYWRSASAAQCLADDTDWLAQITQTADVLHFSGITLAILPPEGRARLCAALRAARQRGATVAFDTNLRPKLWESPDAMRAGLTLGASVASLVLPSFDEEVVAFGDATPHATAERYAQGGADTVVVKDGAGAPTLWSGGILESFEVPERITPVDTTAAGDSFAAGLLAGLAQGKTLTEATTQACHLAAQVIQHRGALVPQIFEGGET